jgi:hypothetical protein
MMQHRHLEHRFVQHLPDALEPGVLYVSMEYATAAHRCCCGCGEEVVTPFTPTDWKMTFNGETISLWPSIGNWDLACRSHYVIERGRVVQAGAWSDKQVASERLRDKAAKARHYGTQVPISSAEPSEAPTSTTDRAVKEPWIKRWLSRLGW